MSYGYATDTPTAAEAEDDGPPHASSPANWPQAGRKKHKTKKAHTTTTGQTSLFFLCTFFYVTNKAPTSYPSRIDRIVNKGMRQERARQSAKRKPLQHRFWVSFVLSVPSLPVAWWTTHRHACSRFSATHLDPRQWCCPRGFSGRQSSVCVLNSFPPPCITTCSLFLPRPFLFPWRYDCNHKTPVHM